MSGGGEASLGTPRAVARARFAASTRVPARFFEANAERIALACRDLARSFHEGHRLLALGCGAQASDAVHVSVEFVHPVIVGKRALPAIALSGEQIGQLGVLGEPGDVVLGLAAGKPEPVRGALLRARGLGMRTIALVGADGGSWEADHVFSVASDDAAVVQEVHETLYHVLWELVHVFLDHPGTLR